MNIKTYVKRDENGSAYIEGWYNQTVGFEFTEKLAMLEEAEKENYIKRCQKCGSYKVNIGESHTDYYCDNCKHRW